MIEKVTTNAVATVVRVILDVVVVENSKDNGDPVVLLEDAVFSVSMPEYEGVLSATVADVVEITRFDFLDEQAEMDAKEAPHDP